MSARMVRSGGASRRQFLRVAVPAAGATLLGCATVATAPHATNDAAPGDAEVTPGEDLMQEHGVIERILLIYSETRRRIELGGAVDLGPVANAAKIVREFVEEYHEKLEEGFVFPKLESARREVELVAVLRRQHQRGRELTAEVLRAAAAGKATHELHEVLRGFERMYRPHAAREDTVLFPAFRAVVGRNGYAELGETFEDEEHRRFGKDGFESTVSEIARLEAALGIGDLAAFTPS